MFEKKPLYIIPPHKNISRPAKKSDAEFIAREATEMMLLAATLEQARENFSDVFAIHHSQVSRKPIDFFIINPTNATVIKDYKHLAHFVIINPEIVRHTGHTVKKKEGCLSFPKELNRPMDRWNKIEATYQFLDENLNDEDLIDFSLSDERPLLACSGLLSQIFQHEIGHANAKCIFNF